MSEQLAVYIKKHAGNSPDKIAIKYNGTAITYRELDRASDEIAGILLEKEVKPPAGSDNINVVTILDRSPGIIISIIGILKAGMVFVPVDTHIPGNRMELLLTEIKARWVITTSEYHKRYREMLEKNKQADLLLIDQPQPGSATGKPAIDPVFNKYCYIYFTSGSTGIPKGILGRQKSLHHYIRWQIDEFSIDETYRVSQFIPPTFDPYLRDIFVPLTVGGTICIPPYNTLMDPAKLIAWIDENKITLIHIVPSLFKLISEKIPGPDHFAHLKYIFLAGEMLRGSDIRRFVEMFGDRVRLVNQYGPTETTLAKFFYRVEPADINRTVIPVGKPITGAEALILDERGQKCLTGNSGEIYIRTPYISSGYFNKKELNKEVFIKNPFSDDKNDIIYKTGDIGRFLFDGNIELTGRSDNQVKIRGNRVEPGEIENHLSRLEDIKEAAVVDKEDRNGEKYLCAYIVPTDKHRKPGITRLKTILNRELPAYMVPSYFVILDALPLNPNGKVDRKALKNRREESVETGVKHIEPGNALEKKIAGVWQEVLNLEKTGIDDNFFNVGGTSLNAIKANSKINEMLKMEIPIVRFFEHPTIRTFAAYLESGPGPGSNRETHQERMDAMTQKRTYLASRKQKLKELRDG